MLNNFNTDEEVSRQRICDSVLGVPWIEASGNKETFKKNGETTMLIARMKKNAFKFRRHIRWNAGLENSTFIKK